MRFGSRKIHNEITYDALHPVRIEWNAFYNFLCNALISLHPVLAGVPIATHSTVTLAHAIIRSVLRPCAANVLHALDGKREWVRAPCKRSASECVCVCVWMSSRLLLSNQRGAYSFGVRRIAVDRVRSLSVYLNSWVDAGKLRVPLSPPIHFWADIINATDVRSYRTISELMRTPIKC